MNSPQGESISITGIGKVNAVPTSPCRSSSASSRDCPRGSRNSRRGFRGSFRCRRPQTTDNALNSCTNVPRRPCTVPADPSKISIPVQVAQVEHFPAPTVSEDTSQEDADTFKLGKEDEKDESAIVAVDSLAHMPESETVRDSLEPLIEDEEHTKEASSRSSSFSEESCSHPHESGGVPRLCGRCPPHPPNTSLITYPSRRLHEDLRASYIRCKQEPRSSANKNREAREGTLVKSRLEITELPSPPKPSAFSQRQYGNMEALAKNDVFRLECSLLQHKVKEPLMRIEARAQIEDEDALQAMRLDCAMASIRSVARKKFASRNAADRRMVLEFLRKLPFFKDHKAQVLCDISKHCVSRRIDANNYIFKRGEYVSDIFILLDGQVSVEGQRVSEDTFLSASSRHSRRESMFQRRRDSGIADANAWKTRQPKLAPFLSAKEAGSGASILGLWDVFVEGQSPPQAYTDPRYSHSPKAMSEVDVIVIPGRRIAHIIEVDAMGDRIKVLQEMFPLTKGKTVEELTKPSKVVRHGRNVAIHELFELTNVKLNTSFHVQGEKYPIEEANIVMIVEGEAQLKSRGRVVDVVAAGGMLGEEALYGDFYEYTASIRTEEGARILNIAADDYIREFQGGRLKKSKNKAAQMQKSQTQAKDPNFGAAAMFKKLQKARGNLKARVSHHSEYQTIDGDAIEERGLRDTFDNTAQVTLPSMRRTAKKAPWRDLMPSKGSVDPERITLDKNRVMAEEWKRLGLKKLPPRVAPPSAHATKGLADELGLFRTVSTDAPEPFQWRRRFAMAEDNASLAQELMATCNFRRKPHAELDAVNVQLVSATAPDAIPSLVYGGEQIALPRIPSLVVGLKSRPTTKQNRVRDIGAPELDLPKLL